ncbi:MAG: DUF2959 domain-containing protein [Proteobacteria bacterium]|nr:DUF2959 domain-containing protein [Desulfobacula sp.]MBU3952578.1 DUF2959 domain-containing protein [Pseudomonadota bacterium]MBU4131041.1 DUF2959 domain-containing protein [Pseudomonadota bacterium]
MKPTCFKSIPILIFAVWGVMFLSGCNKAYYSAMEKIGKEKRHILVADVQEVKESQTKAQDEFKDALSRIRELYAFNGKDLEIYYKRLKASYEDCDARAIQVEKRVNIVKQVALDLFTEWEGEIKQINDAGLKASSLQTLTDAKKRYKQLDIAMNKATQGMYPVLAKLNDHTLYLKHNLNAKAVGSMGNEVVSIEQEVAALIENMTLSIREADNFIKNF